MQIFAGQWSVKKNHDPLCVKSHIGYMLLVGNCPVHWVSKLSTEVAVSTMEVEYIALSTAMHDLIPLRTLVDEVKEFMNADILPCQTFSKVFEDHNGALVLVHDSTVKTHHCQIHITVKYHFFMEHVHQGEKFILRKSHWTIKLLIA